MPKEKDTFQYAIRNHAKFHASSTLTKGKKGMRKFSLQLQFGINRKEDNQFKTKQINLF